MIVSLIKIKLRSDKPRWPLAGTREGEMSGSCDGCGGCGECYCEDIAAAEMMAERHDTEQRDLAAKLAAAEAAHGVMRSDLMDMLAAARAEAVTDERARVWKLARDVVASRKATAKAVGYNNAYRAALDDADTVMAAHEQRDLVDKPHGADLMGAVRVTPLEARVAELEGALRSLVKQVDDALLAKCNEIALREKI